MQVRVKVLNEIILHREKRLQKDSKATNMTSKSVYILLKNVSDLLENEGTEEVSEAGVHIQECLKTE